MIVVVECYCFLINIIVGPPQAWPPRGSCIKRMIFQKKLFSPWKSYETQIDTFCCREIPYTASRFSHWISSKIHFCNTSNVLGSFLEGTSPAGGPVGHPLCIKILIISLVSCVFAAQGWVCVRCCKNVLFSRNLILTKVRSISVSFDEALFGCLVTGVSSRVVLLTKVICRFVTNRLFCNFS